MDQKDNMLLERVNIGIVTTDADLIIQYANKYALRTLSFGREEILDRSLSSLFPSAEQDMKNVLKSGLSGDGRYRFLDKDKRLIGNIVLIGNKNDKGLILTLLQIADIPQAVTKQDSYLSLQEELEPLFSRTQHGNWICDGDGMVLSMNKAAEQLNGVPAREIVGKKAWYLLEKGYVDQSASGQVVKLRKRVSIIQYMKKTCKYLQVTATPVFDDQGNMYRIVVNEKDITGLHSLRGNLRQSEMLAEKLRDEISELKMLKFINEEIIAESEKMKQALITAIKLARINVSNVLILGESGSGKGLLANFIHNQSQRKAQPFMHINCAALPESLLEAELFGYEKGAFTGAMPQGKIGLIELAQNGTLFLDEIGDMTLPMQSKLLTYLDDFIVRPVGGVKEKKVPTNIIAATNKDLTSLIQKRLFREDLFFRLNDFTLKIPPLRERPEDVFGLARFFLKKYNKQFKMNNMLSARLIQTLQSYSFPGNVRELESIIKQAVVLGEDAELNRTLIDKFAAKEKISFKKDPDGNTSFEALVEQFEKKILQEAISEYPSTRKLAEHLCLSQSKVSRKLRKFGLKQ